MFTAANMLRETCEGPTHELALRAQRKRTANGEKRHDRIRVPERAQNVFKDAPLTRYYIQ